MSIGVFLYAFALLSYFASINHDDSLFFANAINNFSVLEFSPHFPGYPTFILFLKALNLIFEDASLTLHFVNIFSTIICMLLSSLLVREFTNNLYALALYILLCSSSVMFFSSLLMMSDSFGLALFLCSFYLLKKDYTKSSSIVLALALWARPSYLVLVLALLLYKKQGKYFLYFFFTCFVILLGLLAYEGVSYIEEAIRFVQGHFSIWGKGQFEKEFIKTSWFDVLLQLGVINSSLIFISSLLMFFTKNKFLKAIFFIFITYTIWIVFAQNPNSIRHIIPLVVLGNILFVVFLYEIRNKIIKGSLFFILLFSSNLYTNDFLVKKAPLEQVIKSLDKDSIIITNYGLFTLKQNGFKVLDKYYLNSSRSFVNTKKHENIYVLSTSRKSLFKDFKLIKTYKGRIHLEKALYLFKKLSF